MENERVNQDKTAETWDKTKQKRFCTQNAPLQLHKVRYGVLSPDGRCLAFLKTDQTVEVSEPLSGRVLCTYRGHQDMVNVLAWSPGGEFISSGGADASVHVWEARTGRHIFTHHGHTSPVHVLVWSPDGKQVVSASACVVQIWQVERV